MDIGINLRLACCRVFGVAMTSERVCHARVPCARLRVVVRAGSWGPILVGIRDP